MGTGTQIVLGDHRALVFKSGTRWRFACSCGCQSTTRRTKDLAVEAALYHVRKARAGRIANGQDG